MFVRNNFLTLLLVLFYMCIYTNQTTKANCNVGGNTIIHGKHYASENGKPCNICKCDNGNEAECKIYNCDLLTCLKNIDYEAECCKVNKCKGHIY